MILSRWSEVAALREAYDDLLDRMEATIESVFERVGPWFEQQGYEWKYDTKFPAIWAWKSNWEKPRGEPLVTLEVTELAPLGYGKVERPHPQLWVGIEGLERIKLREADRVRFARDLKAALGPLAATWDHVDCDETVDPLARYRTDLAEPQRVELVSQPARLVEFLEASFTELFELVPAIEQTLTKYRESK
jgi:hypothetical protein